MQSGCARTGERVSRRNRRGNGRQVLFRLGIHADRRSLRQLRAVFDGCVGVPLVRLHVSCCADACAAQVDPQTARQSEEVCSILRFYGDALISRLIVALTDRRIGLLGNHIHGNGARAGKFRRACRKAHRDGLRRAVTLAVLRRAIVRIVCFD